MFHQVLLDYERHITNADASELSVPIASKSEPKLPKPPKLPKSEPKHVDNKVNFKLPYGSVFFNIDHNFMIPLVYCLVVIFFKVCTEMFVVFFFFFDKIVNSHEKQE